MNYQANDWENLVDLFTLVELAISWVGAIFARKKLPLIGSRGKQDNTRVSILSYHLTQENCLKCLHSDSSAKWLLNCMKTL